MKDLQGRDYATVAETKEGSVLQIDGDFTCMRKNSKHTVKKNEHSELFVSCRDGNHYLDGQLSDDGSYYVGMYTIT